MLSMEQLLPIAIPVFLGLVLRSGVLLHPYSGQSKPPLYGDYEAQRHWMEVTTNLPIRDWYTNSTDNDLHYWGLDYPPLTAYHSWLMGKISACFDPAWTKLYSSRGIESYDHKVFMRYTVLLADLVIFVPAVLYFFYRALRSIHSYPCISPFYSCCLMLIYPGLILIDHGHFQYNCVSLGLFIAAVSFFLRDCDILGTTLFCLSICYKQTELYHSLPLFFYLLGKCSHCPFRAGLSKLVGLSFAVVSTLCIVFSPYLTDLNSLYQVIRRIFPLDRGLFEDKVANFWCSTSPFFKWRLLGTQNELISLCSFVVLLTCLPSCVSLLCAPRKKKLLFALAASSMNFFLFSYQVHEKSILPVAISGLCLLPLSPVSSFLFTLTSTLSMWPLFLKDGLAPVCFCTIVMYTIFCYSILLHRPQKTLGFSYPRLLLAFVLGSFGLLFLTETFVSPPAAYPDLMPLAVSVLSFVQFVVFGLFWNWKVFVVVD